MYGVLAASVGVTILSFQEHRRNIRPSDTIVLYLVATLAIDLVSLAVPLRFGWPSIFYRATCFEAVVKLVFLVLESKSKKSVLRDELHDLPPEELAGVLSLTYFWWLHDLLSLGYHKILSPEDLPKIDTKLDSDPLRQRILASWDKRGSWIVVTAVFVYFGLMTSTAIYRHLLNRIEIMFRGALVGIIHQKALTGRSHAYDDGKALTLISTDAVELEGSAEVLHEMWAFCLEAVIGFSMLAMEIGWLWPLPTAVEDVILQLRDNELIAAKGVRWINVLYNSSANALGLFSPVITVALYAIISSANGKEFDTRTAFTTTAILSMITHPINMVMTILPRIAASMSSFERIQAYLLRPSVDDKRAFIDSEDSGQPPSAVVFTDVAIGDQQSGKSILESLNFSIDKGSVAIINGPVGVGKTLLAHTILGEVGFQKGTVSVSSLQMAFCSQTAWLPNRTVRECILGLDGDVLVDQMRYERVLEACSLNEDLEELHDGDETVVGTGGQNLSGGQRQRVAIARAVYSHHDIFVFDDSFSALDGKTQGAVINNLLGLDGLLRNNNTTVLWVANNKSYFHLADKIVLLEDGTVKYQGDFQHSNETTLQQIFTETAARREDSDGLTENDTTQAKTSSPSRKVSSNPPAATPDYQRKDGDLSLYKYYITSAGIGNVLLLVLMTATFASFSTMPALYLKWWTESKSDNTVLYALGYVSMMVVAWLATSLLKWTDIILVAGRSGEILHRRLLQAICK
ncbi:hypothetical protein Sste5346_001133 [Sporothrix stenoceras]|uniref:ABC transporter domain-containing protein n=1 Tax=Sporothrix stenoceras TaxID=5173 RepID=A0ABR3ZQK3_9PEZI